MNPLLASLDNARFSIDRLRVGAHFLRLVVDPEETDRLFDILGIMDKHRTRFPEVMAQVLETVRADPSYRAQEAASYLPAKPVLAQLALLEPGTLGRAYYDHIAGNGLDEQFYPDLAIDDAVSYLSQRMMMAHDIWHVVTGFSTSVPDELGLQAFTYAQTASPFAASVVAAALMHVTSFKFTEVGAAMAAIERGMALGRRARPMLAYPFDQRWDWSLESVRESLGIVV